METKKFGFIDTLRGLAVLYVVAFHLSVITMPQAVAPQWLGPIIGAGASGVFLFFLVSAFTLCMSMEARGTGVSEPLRNFYVRRLFRIAPLFYAWLTAYYVYEVGYCYAVQRPGIVADNVLFIFNVIPGQQDGYVPASWTIGVEMLFYAVFPIIFFQLRKIGVAVACCVLALALRVPFHAFCLRALDASVGEVFYEHSIVFNFAVFIAGIVLYDLYKLIDPVRAERVGAGHALNACAVGGLVWLCYVGNSFDRTTDVMVETALFAALLLGLAISPVPVFVNRITRFYGRISYSVYLSHPAVVFFMSPIFAFVYRRTEYKTLAFGTSMVLALAVITPLSYATYRFVERPGNALGRWLISRRAVVYVLKHQG